MGNSGSKLEQFIKIIRNWETEIEKVIMIFLSGDYKKQEIQEFVETAQQ